MYDQQRDVIIEKRGISLNEEFNITNNILLFNAYERFIVKLTTNYY